jgi:integrase
MANRLICWYFCWYLSHTKISDTNTLPLTDAAVRNSKPQEKPIKLSDGGGLHLFVTPSGSRLWRMHYRFGGKQKTLSFGTYPKVSLAEARTKREEAKELLSAGVDPGVQHRIEKLNQQISVANTFSVIADEYIEKLTKEGRAPATLSKTGWLLDFARPLLGDRPISEISSVEVLTVLRVVERRGRLESARRLRSTIGSVFRYAIATARAQNDPTLALRGALITPTVTPRAAITDPQKFGALLRAIDGFDGKLATRAALQLMALLFPRPGELRAAMWDEFNLNDAVWVIPARRTKMRRPHKIYLAPQALFILRTLRENRGRGPLLFPGLKSVVRPISENTLNSALRRMGYGPDEMTSHGFRASASTILNESGLWSVDAIERQLAHVENNDVRRAYARGEYWDERVKMMTWWADQLDKLREKGAVVEFKKAANN